MGSEKPATHEDAVASSSQLQQADDALAALSVNPHEDLSIMVKDGLDKVDLTEVPSMKSKLVQTIMESKLADISPAILVEGMVTFINCLRFANFGAIALGDDSLVEEVHEVCAQMLKFIDSCFTVTSDMQVTCREIVETLSVALQFLMEEESEESDEQMKEVSEQVKQLGQSFKEVLETAGESEKAAESLRQNAMKLLQKNTKSDETHNPLADMAGAKCLQGIKAIKGFIQMQVGFWGQVEARNKRFTDEQASMKRSFKKVVKSKVAQMLLYRTMCGYRALEDICRQNTTEIRQIRKQFYKQCSEHPDKVTAIKLLAKFINNPDLPTAEDMDSAVQEVVKEEKEAEANEKKRAEESRRADEERRRALEERRIADEEKRRVDKERREEEEERRVHEERRRDYEERRRAEKERAEEERRRYNEERRADKERRRAEEERRADEERRRYNEQKRADEERRRADEERRRDDEERRRAEDEWRRADERRRQEEQWNRYNTESRRAYEEERWRRRQAEDSSCSVM